MTTELEKFLAVNGRRVFRLLFGYKDKFETNSENSDYFGQEASNLIRNGLMSNEPFAVSRFGHSELRALLTYLHIKSDDSSYKKILNYVRGNKVEPWWHENTVRQITHNAGVFPNKIEIIEEFCRLTLKEMNQIDVLGSWLGGESWIKDMMAKTKFMRFHDFYHFLHEHPWTSALEGKRVLVVHPFATSIQKQFELKDKIFSAPHTLPDFELITYRSVQSIAGNIPGGYVSWFDALDAMKKDISAIDFDVAILGCGAYGMPLATFVKTALRKKAVHLGGNVQILFGIKGSRWENDPNFQHIFNPYWTKPLLKKHPLVISLSTAIVTGKK